MHNSSVSSSSPFFGFVPEPRTLFLLRTYEHLLLALVTFIVVDFVLFQSGVAAVIEQITLGVHWLPIAVAVVVLAWLGRAATRQAGSTALQYLALGSFVLAQAIISLPLLFRAEASAIGILESADVVALLGALSLTGLVLGMRNNFVLGRSLLLWWLLSAGLFMLARVLLGATPGVSVLVGVVSLGGVLILCQTAALLPKYADEQPIPAALELLTAITLPLNTLIAVYHYLRSA